MHDRIVLPTAVPAGSHDGEVIDTELLDIVGRGPPSSQEPRIG